MDIKVYYRLAPKPAGSKKNKIDNATKKHCLENTVQIFGKDNVTVVGDNLTDDLKQFIENFKVKYVPVNFGNGSETFRKAVELAIRENDESDFVYLLEDDFLHLPNSKKLLLEALNEWDCYVTLYDHPDKYIDAIVGGNPQIEGGGEVTKLLMTDSVHWKMTNSTVMTFACRVKRLEEDLEIIKKYSKGSITDSYGMFTELRDKDITVISSVPGNSTHCEEKWLSPLTNWRKL